eukprot:5658816-Pyramimonas_sp.AAC.1
MGGGASIPTHRGRAAAVGCCDPRSRRLVRGGRQMGGPSRSGGLAAVGNAAKVRGMGDTQLHNGRAQLKRAQFGPVCGSSRTMEFLLPFSHCPRSDPTFIADEYPLAHWMKAKWELSSKPKATALASMHAQNHSRTWQTVQGSAGAVL